MYFYTKNRRFFRLPLFFWPSIWRIKNGFLYEKPSIFSYTAFFDLFNGQLKLNTYTIFFEILKNRLY